MNVYSNNPNEIPSGGELNSARKRRSKKRKRTNYHEEFARTFLEDPEDAKEFNRLFLPPQSVEELNLSALRLGKRELESGSTPLIADVVYDIPLKNMPEISALTSVIVEHKSHFQKWTPVQGAMYAMTIMFRRYRKALQELRKMRKEAKKRNDSSELEELKKRRIFLSPVVVLVLYHGEKKLEKEMEVRDLYPVIPGFEGYLLNMKMITVSLTDLDLSRLKIDPKRPKVRIGLEALQAIIRPDAEESLKVLVDKVVASKQNFANLEDCQDFGSHLIRYMGNRIPEDEGEVVPEINQEFTKKLGGSNMQGATLAYYKKTLAEGRKEGLAEGLNRGLAEGKAKGRAEATLRLLAVRFGAEAAESVRPALLAISDLEKQEKLFDLAIDCNSIEMIQQNL